MEIGSGRFCFALIRYPKLCGQTWLVWLVAGWSGLSMRIASRPIALSVNERPERRLVIQVIQVIQSSGARVFEDVGLGPLRKPVAWHPVLPCPVPCLSPSPCLAPEKKGQKGQKWLLFRESQA